MVAVDRDRYVSECKRLGIEIPEKKAKAPKLAKRAKGKTDTKARPKRARSAYVLFGIDARAKLKISEPSLEPKMAMTRLGELWKQASPEVKKKYEDMSAQEKSSIAAKKASD